MPQPDYNDSSPMCAETGSTLSVRSDVVTPEEITEALQIKPTDFHRKGDSLSEGLTQAESNRWFYSTYKLSTSKDTGRHIDLVLKALEGKADVIAKLRSKGCKLRLASHWAPANPEVGGGPSLTPRQMLELGRLGIDVRFWFVSPGENQGPLKQRR